MKEEGEARALKITKEQNRNQVSFKKNGSTKIKAKGSIHGDANQ